LFILKNNSITGLLWPVDQAYFRQACLQTLLAVPAEECPKVSFGLWHVQNGPACSQGKTLIDEPHSQALLLCFSLQSVCQNMLQVNAASACMPHTAQTAAILWCARGTNPACNDAHDSGSKPQQNPLGHYVCPKLQIHGRVKERVQAAASLSHCNAVAFEKIDKPLLGVLLHIQHNELELTQLQSLCVCQLTQPVWCASCNTQRVLLQVLLLLCHLDVFCKQLGNSASLQA